MGTRRITTMHRRLAEQMVRTFPLVMRELPFAIPPIREVVQWHITNNNDRALRWVVERMEAIAQHRVQEQGNVVRLDSPDDLLRDELAVRFQADSSSR